MSKITLVSDKEFHKYVEDSKDGQLPQNYMREHALGVRKGYTGNIKSINPEKRTIDFVISDASVDRMGDTVAVNGWDLKNYKQNPVVLFAHDNHSPPIAKAVRIRKDNTAGLLTSRAEFMSQEMSPFAYSIFRMYVEGYMKATSVGFLPTDWQKAEETDKNRPAYGIDFLKQELLEFSAVPVPANPNALVDARAKGIQTEYLKSWAEKVLDSYEEYQENGLMLPKKQLELIRKQADPLQRRLHRVSSRRRQELRRENLKMLEEQKMTKIRDAYKQAFKLLVAKGSEEDSGVDKAALVKEFTDSELKAPWEYEDAWSGLIGTLKSGASDFDSLEALKTAFGEEVGEDYAEAFEEEIKAIGPTVDDEVDDDADDEEGVLELDTDDEEDKQTETEEARALADAEDKDEDNFEVRGAISYASAHKGGTPKAPKNAPWDGNAAMTAAGSDKVYHVICAWVDSGASDDNGDGWPDNRSAYKLPHHKGSGNHSVVWRGVANAAARLPQTNVPAGDKGGIRAHLGRHYKEFDETPPWSKDADAWEKYCDIYECILAGEDYEENIKALEEVGLEIFDEETMKSVIDELVKDVTEIEETKDIEEEEVDEEKDLDEEDVIDDLDEEEEEKSADIEVENTLRSLIELSDILADSIDCGVVDLEFVSTTRAGKRLIREASEALFELAGILDPTLMKSVDEDEEKEVEAEKSCDDDMIELEFDSDESQDDSEEIDLDVVRDVISELLPALIGDKLDKRIKELTGKVD